MADLTENDVKEAIEALHKAEALLAKIDRSGVLDAIEELRGAIEALPQVQLDMRITRMRLSARLSHDPDKTPVEHVKGLSQMALRLETKKT